MTKHRTKQESAELQATLRAAVKSDFEIKQLAGELGLSVTYAHRMVRQLGFRAMLVSATERAAILHMRAMTKETRSSA